MSRAFRIVSTSGRTRTFTSAAAAFATAITGGYYFYSADDDCNTITTDNFNVEPDLKYPNQEVGISSSSPALFKSVVQNLYRHHPHTLTTTQCDSASIISKWSPPPPTKGKELFASSSDNLIDDNEGLKNYPNLSRLGPHSYLRKYLTPEVYLQLKDVTTKSGVTLEHVIQSGVSLPWGSSPDRIGVFAGDEECYTVFAPLLLPIIRDFHAMKARPGSSRIAGFGAERRLRRSSTNLNPQDVLSQELDPKGEYVLYSRMRVSRSISGFQFGPVISRHKRRVVEELCKSCFEDWKHSGDPVFEKSTYTSVLDMTNEEYNDLTQRHLIFLQPSEYKLTAGLGRDWPDGRGLFLNNPDLPEIQVWCNHQDHLRIISMSRGGDLLAVFTRLSQTIRALERSLQTRGFR